MNILTTITNDKENLKEDQNLNSDQKLEKIQRDHQRLNRKKIRPTTKRSISLNSSVDNFQRNIMGARQLLQYQNNNHHSHYQNNHNNGQNNRHNHRHHHHHHHHNRNDNSNGQQQYHHSYNNNVRVYPASAGASRHCSRHPSMRSLKSSSASDETHHSYPVSRAVQVVGLLFFFFVRFVG